MSALQENGPTQPPPQPNEFPDTSGGRRYPHLHPPGQMPNISPFPGLPSHPVVRPPQPGDPRLN